MKNQETIFAIKHDIAILQDNIRLREAWQEMFGIKTKQNKLDKIAIKKMQKTIAKLETADRKTWEEALKIAHAGKIKAWWIENWGWVWIGFLIVLSIVAIVVLWRII